MFAGLLISGRDWLVPAALLGAAALVTLVLGYRHLPADPKIRTACFSLKAIGLLALAVCLIEPLWSNQRARPGSNYFAVVADNSQGMQIKDAGAAESRGQTLRAILTAPGESWLEKLAETFQVRRFLFDSRLEGTQDFSELAFEGRSSAIATSLKKLSQRFHGQPLAGVLLFTDGNATDVTDALPDLAGLPPIYPVVIGTDDPIRDIALKRVTVNQTSFEDAPVTVQADVATSGFEGHKVLAQIWELPRAESSFAPEPPRHVDPDYPGAAEPAEEKKPITEPRLVEKQTVIMPPSGEVAALRFQLRPERRGISFYKVTLALEDIPDPQPGAVKADEAILANNERIVVVDRGQGPFRILYVAGRPNWEFKFLNRALVEDDQLEMSGLIRIAKREPKFEFKGRSGEQQNPLFRGFDPAADEAARYDQPVLIRLNTRDDKELQGGFPKTAEELYNYHAIVLDDLEAEFFSFDQMTLIQKFVSERGGGLLMLGGQESFHEGKYGRTPIGSILPIYLDRPMAAEIVEDLKLDLTREGWLQPWARLRPTETEEKTRLENMAPFHVLNQIRETKPGASVIATVTDSRGATHPALAVQRFGNGRTASLMIGDMWRWGLQEQAPNQDMAKAWRQLARWLVTDVPERVELQVDKDAEDPNEAVHLRVQVRDKAFQPLDNAAVTISIFGPQSHSPEAAYTNSASAALRIHTESAADQAGAYTSTYIPRDSGPYYVEAAVLDAEGMEVGRDAAGWTSDPAAEEFSSLNPNRALLEAIARNSGGEVISAERLMDFVQKLPNRKAPITEVWSYPLWHQAWVFLFALACFAGEWGLRRWKGLA